MMIIDVVCKSMTLLGKGGRCMAQFRHELKYLITARQRAMLLPRLRTLMRPDPYTGPDGIYSIRSLYFDDAEDTCFYQNENGTDPREKFRVRIYGADGSPIHLELKRKEHGMTQKLACPVTEAQCRALMAGRPLSAGEFAGAPRLLQELVVQQRTRRLRPKVIVAYDRIPFVHPLGNVRVTLDQALASSAAIDRFLEPSLPARGVLSTGRLLLEVKFDEFLPDHLYRALQLESLQQTAFSKYYLCRRYPSASALPVRLPQPLAAAASAAV